MMLIKNKIQFYVFFTLLITLFCSQTFSSVHAAGPAGIPPWPSIFSGEVTVDGVPAEDGLKIVGIIDDYVSNPVYTKNGRISGLTVGGPSSAYFGKDILFLLEDVVYADQVPRYLNVAVPSNTPISLTFPAIPLPTATPLPTSTPLPTAVPTLVGPVVPTPVIPTPTPTTVPIGPSDIGPLIFSGTVIVSGGANVEGFEISASLADFPTTYPSVIDSDLKYHNLVIDTSEDDRLYDGAEITFYLNGPGIDPVNSLKSNVTATYSQTKDVISILDLVFVPASPLKIPEPAKEEEVFLKFTPTPTSVPVAPTATVVTLPTSLPVEDEQNESSAACNKPVGNVSLFTGMGNIMTMVGPLIFFIAYRRVRKFWD